MYNVNPLLLLNAAEVQAGRVKCSKPGASEKAINAISTTSSCINEENIKVGTVFHSK